jgi:hypothetical protein
VTLSKADARRAMVRHHFSPAATIEAAFERLRSIQFDPIAPVGCNHDLVLQSRVEGYKISAWESTAYEHRLVYDGWDKQACLIRFAGWPARRIFHKWFRSDFCKIFDDHPQAVNAILRELETKGPLSPKECEFQERKEEWKDSWHGPNLSKQTLRALWYTGLVMTTSRRKGQHVYDLTERVVPPHIHNQPELSEEDSIREMVLDRHRAVGLLRPSASYEVWSFRVKSPAKHAAIAELVRQGRLLPVNIEGVSAHATPEFLALLDTPSLHSQVRFIAPLDQFLWDRKMVAHLFGFDYVWEIYVPEAKRRWGYYVLPVLYGDELVARAEFWCRKGVLELRCWHFEAIEPGPEFFPALAEALQKFMKYCSATIVSTNDTVDKRLRAIAKSLGSA